MCPPGQPTSVWFGEAVAKEARRQEPGPAKASRTAVFFDSRAARIGDDYTYADPCCEGFRDEMLPWRKTFHPGTSQRCPHPAGARAPVPAADRRRYSASTASTASKARPRAV